MGTILATPGVKERKLVLARQRFPGERIWQCDGCGHAAPFGSAEPLGPTKCTDCGGTVRPCDSADVENT